MVRRAVVAATVALIAIVISDSPVVASHFFWPTPPPGARIVSAHGTLAAWGRGNAQGSIVLTTDSGTDPILREGRHTTIDGVVIDCFRAPDGTAKRDPAWCANWPPNVHLGSTKATAHYWTQREGEENVFVTNRLITDAGMSRPEASR